MAGHGVVKVSNDVSYRLTVVFSYNPQLVASIRVIEDHKWRLSLLLLRGRFDRSNLSSLPIRIASVRQIGSIYAMKM